MPASNVAASDAGTAPPQDKIFRIAYIEGGEYECYQAVMRGLIRGLTELGWIGERPLPQPTNNKENFTYLQWLSEASPEKHLEFPSDARFSSAWNKEMHTADTAALVNRLNGKKDIDLVLAFGTWAGKSMATAAISTPVVVLSSSDPVEAGITKSAGESAHGHIHVKVDPGRYERQILFFYKATHFKRIGVVHRDDAASAIYAAMDDLRRLSEGMGFEVAECVYREDYAGVEGRFSTPAGCYEHLAPTVDAFYVTEQPGLGRADYPALLKPLFEHRIPTFAQSETGEAKYGILFGPEESELENEGRIMAESLCRILNGASPGELSQKVTYPLEMGINLETAKRIDFAIPPDILAEAKTVYERIEPPPVRR